VRAVTSSRLDASHQQTPPGGIHLLTPQRGEWADGSPRVRVYDVGYVHANYFFLMRCCSNREEILGMGDHRHESDLRAMFA
jgi:hypothetical protein